MSIALSLIEKKYASKLTPWFTVAEHGNPVRTGFYITEDEVGRTWMNYYEHEKCQWHWGAAYPADVLENPLVAFGYKDFPMPKNEHVLRWCGLSEQISQQ